MEPESETVQYGPQEAPRTSTPTDESGAGKTETTNDAEVPAGESGVGKTVNIAVTTATATGESGSGKTVNSKDPMFFNPVTVTRERLIYKSKKWAVETKEFENTFRPGQPFGICHPVEIRAKMDASDHGIIRDTNIRN